MGRTANKKIATKARFAFNLREANVQMCYTRGTSYLPRVERAAMARVESRRRKGN